MQYLTTGSLFDKVQARLRLVLRSHEQIRDTWKKLERVTVTVPEGRFKNHLRS